MFKNHLSAKAIKKNNKNNSVEDSFYQKYKNIIDNFNNFKKIQKKSFIFRTITNLKKINNFEPLLAPVCIFSFSFGILNIASNHLYSFIFFYISLTSLILIVSSSFRNLHFNILCFCFNIKFNDIEKKYLNDFIKKRSESYFIYDLLINIEPKQFFEKCNEIIKLSQNITTSHKELIFKYLLICKLDFLFKKELINKEEYLNTIHFYAKELNIKDRNVLTESVEHIEDIFNNNKKQTKSIDFFENKINILKGQNLINKSSENILF